MVIRRFFSTAVIEDAALNPDGQNVGIQKEIDRIIEALEPYNYFTIINFGGKNLTSKLIGDVAWEIVQNRIKMRFTIAVNERVGVTAHSWSYAIFDPTYYIEMLHDEHASIKIVGDAAVKCKSWVEQPMCFG